MEITFVRHGEMAGDPFVCPERPVNGCLSEENGIPQAEATREALKNEKFDIAFSSPFGRALQTCEIVMTEHDTPIEILPYIYEWMPNMDLKNIPKTDFEDIEKQTQNLYVEETWKTPLGEGYFEMASRICPPFLKTLDKLGVHSRMGGYVIDDKAKDLSIIVFAHGGSLDKLLAFLLKIPPFPAASFSFELTGVAKIKMKESNGIFHPSLIIPALHTLS